MDVFTSVLAGFGLSAPAGLNAWLPLLITGLAARLNFIKLAAPFDMLSNTWVLLIIGLLLTIEVFADKIPAVDTINDVIHTFIRPTAGGILFAAQAGMIGGMDPILGFGLGVLSAGSVHAVKAASRPLITATTGGLGNPLVSFIEDIVAAVATILALIVPILAALIMATILGVAAWIVWRWRERRRRRRQAQI
jgi:mannitol-specific phosphotransferase system IIBC component